MNNKLMLLLLVVVTLAVGYFIGARQPASPAGGETVSTAAPAENKPLYWVAPMDPNYRRDKPGKSPMGMDLVPVYADEDAGDSKDDETIRINPMVENNLGIRTEKVKKGPLWRRIEATAYVGLDETLIANISVRTQGWITHLSINAEGERVKKNQLLFELYSPELVNAQKEYLQARKRNDSRLISGSTEKLRALGMIPNEIAALEKSGKVAENIRVVAPQDGVVAELNVREGTYVQPNTTIMSLADLSSVWLQAEVFESQAEWVAAGQAAKASLDYLPGYEFNGQVDYVYPVLDPKTRTLRVRLRFENPEERLKPNMYARVSIYGKLHPNALSVSREAIIRSKASNRVVVALGDGRFRVHEVLTGVESGDSVEILAGLDEGDTVVTSAQFLLDSEASLAGALRRLDSAPLPQESVEAGPVIASGRVDAVYPERRRIRISHGPIDALAWPAMTMEFDVLGSGRLDNIKEGQNIRFSLQQQLAGEYAIANLGSDADPARVENLVPGQEPGIAGGTTSAESPAPEAAAADVVTGSAVIIEIGRVSRILKLRHEPIAELGWPAMTMNFDVAEYVSLDGLEKGQSINFELQARQGSGYLISAIEVQGAANPPDSGDGHGEQHD
ncbi:MAG TPA: efflux RND transporter periplasmic adaptor subunit [Xanthomonadales bacterium]|nr:efflux RND transporter periplasmic adaptor subunit [Xanthomonadales bacterium]